MTKVKHNTRGMSLMEVLVVMVILVIGIFSVITVFPQGFRFLGHSRNVTLAGRLAQAEIERWKTYADNVPDGIVAEDPTTGLPYTDYDPDDMSNASVVPSGEDTWYWSNVNRVRLIRGEVTRIPSPTILPYGTGGNYAFSLYNLKFAPVAFSSQGTGGHILPSGYEWPDQYVLIYGDALPRKDVTGMSDSERNDALDALDRQTYAIDYTTGKIYFQPTDWTRKYKVSYAYWSGGVLKNDQEIVTVGSSTEVVTIDLSHGSIDDYSDTVSRKFDYVSPGQFDRHNPYQFTLLNNYKAMSFAPTIAFNPVGQNRTVRTNLGSRPLSAHIDYEVVDWHVIHEDRTVPNPTDPNTNGYAIRLSLPNIKVAKRYQNSLNAVNAAAGTSVTQMLYQGLTPDVPGYSVVALDMTDNTLMLDEPGGLVVDYTAGVVRIPASVTKYTPFNGTLTAQDIRGHDIRIFYQAVGDWAVQVSRAWSNFQRRDVGVSNLASLQYNTFDAEIVPPGDTIQQVDYTNDTNDVTAVLIFPRCYAGQAISVSLIWYDVDNVPHEITGHQDKLSEDKTRYPYLAVRLGTPSQFKPSTDANEAWKNPYFTFVQGASLKVRTIWREDPRRWESRDMETFLSRK